MGGHDFSRAVMRRCVVIPSERLQPRAAGLWRFRFVVPSAARNLGFVLVILSEAKDPYSRPNCADTIVASRIFRDIRLSMLVILSEAKDAYTHADIRASPADPMTRWSDDPMLSAASLRVTFVSFVVGFLITRLPDFPITRCIEVPHISRF
jgi:hypothetical protein